MKLPAIATTTVGSFPRPSWLAKPERSQVNFRFDGTILKEAQDDATRLTIQTQERIGLDLLTDGEQRRPHFINHVLAAFNGIDLVHQGVKKIYRRREQDHLVPRIVGKSGAAGRCYPRRFPIRQEANDKADQNGRPRAHDRDRQHLGRDL